MTNERDKAKGGRLTRRQVIAGAGALAAAAQAHGAPIMESPMIKLFLAGDVMTGRGIDQILPHPNAPEIFEPYLTSARDYVRLVETTHGPLETPVDPAYIWGEALAALDAAAPDLRLVNLETSITTSDSRANKQIHYRMHPKNIACLTAARLDGVALANNHVLDWGRAGLEETLGGLASAGIAAAGAGPTLPHAQTPAIFPLAGKGRVLMFSMGLPSSGIPGRWAATEKRPGVFRLPRLTSRTLSSTASLLSQFRRRGDLIIASIHWGPNWGYEVRAAERQFAQGLIDSGAADLVHGHSSHHARGIEVYRGKLILYGCGDFINDYEGIGGHEGYRVDLAVMYLPELAPATGRLNRLEMRVFQSRRFRLETAAQDDVSWLAQRLSEEGQSLGTRLIPLSDGGLLLETL